MKQVWFEWFALGVHLLEAMVIVMALVGGLYGLEWLINEMFVLAM